MPTVAIVDDYALYSEGLKRIFDAEFRDYQVLYTAENGRELQQAFADRSRIPDIILLDVQMPVMGGFETAAWLKEHHPDVLILVLSFDDDERTIIKMVQSGARGYLLKSIQKQELKQALDYLMEKKYYYSEWLTHNVFKSIGHHEQASNLSELELKFLRLAASALTFRQIGDRMCKSERTVEDYRKNLCTRFGLKTRLELVLYALKERIITLDDVNLEVGREPNK